MLLMTLSGPKKYLQCPWIPFQALPAQTFFKERSPMNTLVTLQVKDIRYRVRRNQVALVLKAEIFDSSDTMGSTTSFVTCCYIKVYPRIDSTR